VKKQKTISVTLMGSAGPLTRVAIDYSTSFHKFSTAKFLHISGGKPVEKLILLAACVRGTNEFTTLHRERCRGVRSTPFCYFRSIDNE